MTENLRGVEFDPAVGFTKENAADLVSGFKQRGPSALAMHRLLETSGALSKQRLVTYRCTEHRCMLLDVFHTPEGPAVYFPPFRLSPDANVDTDSEARIERTSDGQRRWIARADLLDMYLSRNMDFWVNCDHLLNYQLDPDDVAEAARRRSGDVFVSGASAR